MKYKHVIFEAPHADHLEKKIDRYKAKHPELQEYNRIALLGKFNHQAVVITFKERLEGLEVPDILGVCDEEERRITNKSRLLAFLFIIIISTAIIIATPFVLISHFVDFLFVQFDRFKKYIQN